MIDYLQAGDKLSDADWAALWSEADARLAEKVNNQAAFLLDPKSGSEYGGTGLAWVLYDKAFFFCDYVNPSAPMTMAAAAIKNYAPAAGFELYKRAYAEAVFSDWVAAASVDSGGTPPYQKDWPLFYGKAGGVVRLVAPAGSAWTALNAAVWPEGGFGGSTSAADFLNYSLHVHTKSVDGVDYNVYVAGGAMAEYVHWWEPVEIVLGDNAGSAGTFTWPASYDKYRLLRFSNVSQGDLIVKLPKLREWVSDGTIDVTVPAMQSLCARMTGFGPSRGWVVGGKYFHAPLQLDPWWRARSRNCNLTDPLNCATMLPNTFLACGGQPGAPMMDGSAVQDVSGIYCGVDLAADSLHQAAPAGGWFPALSSSMLLGNLMFHRGKLMAVQPGADFRVKRVPPMQATITSLDTEVNPLTKADGTPAMLIEAVTVTRVSDGADIPNVSGSDVNWVASINAPPAASKIALTYRTTGASPMLSLGDVVKITFTHAADDHRYLFDYTGISDLDTALSAFNGGCAVSGTDPLYVALYTADDIDLVSLSSNLVVQGFAAPAVTLGGDGVQIGPFAITDSWDYPTRPIKAVLQSSSTDLFYYAYAEYTPGDLTTLYTTSWTTVTVTSSVVLTGDRGYPISYYLTAMEAGPWNVLTKTLEDVASDMGASSAGGAIATSVSAVMTVFGPLLKVVQTIPALYPFDVFSGSDRVNWEIVTVGGTTYFQRTIWMPLTLRRGTSSFVPWRMDWPYYRGGAWIGDPGPPANLNSYLPRTTRVVVRSRVWNAAAAANVLGLGAVSVPGFYQQYFESEPFGENHPIAVFSDPSNAAGMEQVRGVGFLGRFLEPGVPEVWLRLAAWVNYGRVAHAVGSVEDFARGGGAQSGYYSAERSALLSTNNTLTTDDNDAMGAGGSNSGLTASAALPITAEHFNAAASCVNGVERYKRDDLKTKAQYYLLHALEDCIGAGIGAANYRPRTQFAAWTAGSAGDLTTWATAMGLTVLSASDFPAAWSDLVTATTANLTGSGMAYGAAGSLLEQWGPFWDTALSGVTRSGTYADEMALYRWVTIADVQALYGRLGARFVMCELAATGTLAIVDGSPSLIAGSGDGSGGFGYTRAAWWWNDPDGLWLYTPDGAWPQGSGYEIGPAAPLRANVDRTDLIVGGNVTSGLFTCVYTHLDERFYENGGAYVQSPVGISQRIAANRCLLYRRYGSAPATGIVWPVNYADYTRDYSATSLIAAAARYSLGWGVIPRTARNGLEGTAPEFYALRNNEQTITTGLENGMLATWPLNVSE